MNFEIAPKSSETRLNWNDAHLYCFTLNIDGKTGWRLPTEEELYEIYESINDFENYWYWSSTFYDDNRAWSKSFHTGTTDFFSKNYSFRCRAVRDLKDN